MTATAVFDLYENLLHDHCYSDSKVVIVAKLPHYLFFHAAVFLGTGRFFQDRSRQFFPPVTTTMFILVDFAQPSQTLR